jgi:hypothetical protein
VQEAAYSIEKERHSLTPMLLSVESALLSVEKERVSVERETFSVENKRRSRENLLFSRENKRFSVENRAVLLENNALSRIQETHSTRFLLSVRGKEANMREDRLPCKILFAFFGEERYGFRATLSL